MFHNDIKNFLSARTIAALVVICVLVLGLAATARADNASGCDFAANGTTESCVPPLSGSTFAGGDDNLLASPTTFGTTDWQNVAGLVTGIDNPSGAADNSFGQGTKEDNANVTVVSGSIPPNKSDLTRFYAASAFSNNKNFLYLAWERTNSLGSANMDFEINQVATPNLGVPGPHTINRTAGDLLVTFDFTNGGGRPVLGLLTWVTTGSTSQCFSSNSLPCWGNHVTLNGTDSEGAVNNLDAVTDPFSGSSVPALEFGETAIDLTGAGVFPPGTCEAFGSVFLKSRSSSSFPAEVKDFVAPVPVNITNCGTITIIKHTDPRGVNHDFSFHNVDIPGSASFSHPLDGSGNFTLNDNGNTTSDSAGNTQTVTKVPAGTYHITEADPTPGFDLTGLTCTSGGSGSGSTATITITAGNSVTCTFTNTQRGTIIVKKVTVPSPDPTDSTFTFNPTGFNGGASFTEKNGGSQSFGNLVPTTTTGGPYSVSESDPSLLGFDLTSSSCDKGTPSNITVNPGGTTTCTFTNTQRLGAIRVTKESIKGNTPLAGATFTVVGTGVSRTITTDTSGTACTDNLPWSGTGTDYTVTETAAPGGYKIDNPNGVTVTVDHNATCSSGGTPNAPAVFTDTPLSNITISFHSQVAGATTATVQCTGDANPQNLPDGSPRTLSDLVPGTYTCTVVIDP